MAKTEAKARKRRSKAVADEIVEEEDSAKTEGQAETVSSSEEQVGTEADAPKEDQDEEDSQMDTVIEVKGNTSTVTVSWDQKTEEGEVDDTEKKTNGSDQLMDSEEQIISSADAVGSTEDVSSESAETEMKEEIQEYGESQMDVVAESTATVTETTEDKNEEGESNDVQEETNGGERMIVKKKAAKRKLKVRSTAETSPSKKTKRIDEVAVKGKQKKRSAAETSPSKKTKLIHKVAVKGKQQQRSAVETPQPVKKKFINTGFCLFVGNLDNSKKRAEIQDSLAKYLMTQSVLVNHIRVDTSRKFAYVDLASEMDLTKTLTFNGEMLNDKPMEIARARVVTKDSTKASPEDQKEARDGRCLFLKNVPYTATKEDILKIFRKAINVRFLGGTEGPEKGIAFVEFKNKTIANKLWKRKQGVQMQGRILTVDRVGKTATKAAAPPNKTLFVYNLPADVKKRSLKKVFEKASNIIVPKREGKTRGFAIVEFATVSEAKKALESAQNVELGKRLIRVQFSTMPAKDKVLKKTLIVKGLSKKTTAETLKSVFEGALSARITVDKETGVSKRYGFVDFTSEDTCKAVKETMEDCEIDGSKVTVTFALMPGAKPRGPRGPRKPLGGLPLGQGAHRGGRKGKGKGGHGRGGQGLAARMPKKAVKMVGNNESSTPDCPPFIPL